jgi:hypothetical protein
MEAKMKPNLLNRTLLIGFVCLHTGTVFTNLSAQTPYRYEPIIDVYHEPIQFQGNGKTYMTYELHISNVNKWNYDMRIERIEIFNGAYPDDTPLKIYEGDLLSTCVPTNPRTKGYIANATRTAAFLMLSLDDASQVPSSLLHKITYSYHQMKKRIFFSNIESKKVLRQRRCSFMFREKSLSFSVLSVMVSG